MQEQSFKSCPSRKTEAMPETLALLKNRVGIFGSCWTYRTGALVYYLLACPLFCSVTMMVRPRDPPLRIERHFSDYLLYPNVPSDFLSLVEKCFALSVYLNAIYFLCRSVFLTWAKKGKGELMASCLWNDATCWSRCRIFLRPKAMYYRLLSKDSIRNPRMIVSCCFCKLCLAKPPLCWGAVGKFLEEMSISS